MNDASERARGSDDDVAWLLCVRGVNAGGVVGVCEV